MEEKVFFAENGLTSTSANHIANLAKEYVQDEEMELNNIRLVNCYVSVIGSSEKTQTCKGTDDRWFDFFTDTVNRVAKAKCLIAWLREAIKAKDRMLVEIADTSMEDWAAAHDMALPIRPVKRSVPTREELIARLDIKERNRIYTLETEAAIVGKCIHPNGKFAEARRELHHRLSNPIDVKGEGRDTLIYTYEPSCDYDAVNNAFFTLQKWHRESQAALNGILYKIDEQLKEEEISATTEYINACSDYTNARDKVAAEFKLWQDKEAKRIASLKIAIPHDLEEIFDRVNKLGK